MMKNRRRMVSLLLAFALLLSQAACGSKPGQTSADQGGSMETSKESGLPKVQAADLLEAFTARPVAEKAADDSFKNAGFDWAARLFRQMYEQETSQKTMLVSPLSVMIALAMTAGGAEGNTLKEMETVLGGLKIADLNAYLHTYLSKLPSSEKAKFSFANAIWFRDQADFVVKDAFLQTNVDYYDAAIRKAPFDDTTVREINQWVDLQTDHMIDKLLSQLKDSDKMLLVNALVFDAKWEIPFYEEYCQEGSFTNLQGSEDTATYMSGLEHIYLEDEEVTGFIKDYEGGGYRFVALLPKDASQFEKYVQGLTGEKLMKLLQTKDEESHVLIRLPKFSYDYEASLAESLQKMGLREAFLAENADFSGISQMPLYISDVLHKTHIDLDSEGTRAAALTSVMVANGAFLNPKEVNLDRPFVYMIIDSATNLPIFMGTVTGFEK